MPFASYSELAAYAEANFPTAFRALPDPNTYAIVKSSPLGPRVKIGYSSVDSQSAVWALLWSCHGQITYIDGDGWIPVGSFTLEEPYSQLWDGEAQQNALGHPDVFDAFIRYSIMAMGQPGYLQVSNNPLRYHFQPVFRELCEGWPKASLADGDNGEENTATVDHPDMLVSPPKYFLKSLNTPTDANMVNTGGAPRKLRDKLKDCSISFCSRIGRHKDG
ncbi:hypothetical protein ACJBU6_00332 [Exserohilum turcicum]